MWIKQIEIENFKSFLHPEVIAFAPGFNLILGANNAGKSTVLQALDMSQPLEGVHRSVANLPTFGMQPIGQPRAMIAMCISAQEYRQARQSSVWRLPVHQQRWNAMAELSPERRLACVLAEADIVVSTERGGLLQLQFDGDCIWMPPFSRNGVDAVTHVFVIEQSTGPTIQSEVKLEGSAVRELWPQVAACIGRVYRFDASRVPKAISALSAEGALSPNISNLAACVTHLQTNDSQGHKLLCQWVNRVLPHIHTVQAPPVSGSEVELRCFPRSPTERRDDLATPLQQMGSGVGNVVAVLYVLLTSRSPQVICIDEPNQFLHPKALRELLQILASEGKQHQYILTAHSAEVISAVRAETVTLLTLDNGMTRVRQTTHGGLATLRDGFADLGIRATELHGRDQVLWVEGQTEELVFPALLSHFCTQHAAGTAVLRIHDTGAFERRGFDPIRVVEIYRRLTGASALVPPMVAVVLDRERRTADECAKLEADKRANLRFLPRRMLENYLLHPQGLAAVLSELGCAVDADQICVAVARATSVDHLSELDFDQVDGGRLLLDVFAHCSDARWVFKKTRDVPALVEWLIANDPDFLQPLGQWLAGLMDLRDSNA